MKPLDTMTGEEYEDYRLLCDSRTSAEFRMRREMCGIELRELADAIGVRLDTAKRFENPNRGDRPSLRAWAYVDSAYDDLMAAVNAAVDQVEDASDEFGEPQSVRIAYRRAGMPTRDGETVGMANAAARAAAVALAVLGYDVSAEWAADAISARISVGEGRFK